MTNKKTNVFATFFKENLVLIGIVILCIITAIIEPKFLGTNNINNVLKQLGPLPFAALGMTFVITAGFNDLSIPGTISLVGVVVIALIDVIGQVGALAVGIALGAILGWINGWVLTTAGAMIQAEVLFITYGMSSVWTAIGLIVTHAETMRMTRCQNNFGIFTALGTTNFGVVPLILIIFVVILLIMHFFLKKTIWGRNICLVGGNKDAANLVGVNVKSTMRSVYMINGLTAGLASIALLSRTTVATATSGMGYETNAILCVVVGGTSLRGGKGSVIRTMIGVVLITLLGNCMNMLDLSTYMQTVMRGAVLVVAIWLDNRNAQ